MFGNPLCVCCSQKNSIDYDLHYARNLLTQIKLETRNASDEAVQMQETKLRESPWLTTMCEYHKSCTYGIYCRDMEIKVQQIRRNNEELCKELVLLGFVAPEKVKLFYRLFCGHYPKAAKYIESLNA